MRVGTGQTALAAMVDAGMSDAAIADSMGVSDRTILRWRQRDGLASQWGREAAYGGLTRYRKGCRCDRCAQANRDAQAEFRRHAQKVTGPRAARGGMPWTPEEDALLLSSEGGSAMAKAIQLRRTYSSVANRLNVLRRQGADRA
jgi:hypothetical protein